MPQKFDDFTFDGFGINGRDEYRTRLATLTETGQREKVGPLFAASPDLREALEAAWDLLNDSDVRFMICDGGRGHLGEQAKYHAAKRLAQKATSKAKGE